MKTDYNKSNVNVNIVFW